MSDPPRRYVGFWARLLASLVDSVLVLLLLAPILRLTAGNWSVLFVVDPAESPPMTELLIEAVLPALAVLVFWRTRRATPGKSLIGAWVVDADSGARLSLRQSIVRYLGYYLSLLPAGLGLAWIAWDTRKQGWHDKLAGSVVIYRSRPTARARRS